jgi:hypothetical protein
MLLWRNDHAKVFAYAQSRERGGKPAAGLAVKIDGRAFGRSSWRHAQVGVYGPSVRLGRGCWAFEATTWRTRGSENGERATVKAFVRIKVGLGGVGRP